MSTAQTLSGDEQSLVHYMEAVPTSHIAAAVAANIRRTRAGQGLSQAELARRSGVHVNTVRFIESGRVENVRLDTLEAISNALGCEISELVKLEGGVADASKFVEEFLASPLAILAKPTKDEREWLESLPLLKWLGDHPDPEAIFHLLTAKRRSS